LSVEIFLWKGGNAMALLSDMRSLTENLLKDYDARVEAIAGLRINTKQELNNYRNAHQALTTEQEKALDQHMEALRREVAQACLATNKFLKEMAADQQTLTAEQRQKLGEHMQTLRKQVANANQVTVDFLKKINQDLHAMTSDQRQQLTAQMDSLHHQVSELRQAAATFLADVDSSNRAMAAELGGKLARQRSHLAADTAAFIENVSSAHHEMATHQAQQLDEQSEKLRRSVKDQLGDASQFIRDVNTAHQSMVSKQKQNMVTGRHQLKTNVTATRKQLQVDQNALRTDQAEAARAWATMVLHKQKRTMKKSSTTLPKISESYRILPSSAEPAIRSDDFTVIHGIGPIMAKLLSAAGFSSYKQLASSSPEQLRQVLGKSGRLAKVETWITQAQKLIRWP
jgi:predicted flap endonuclease-1-like 5' DNA nuclease/archaellum component FlaC